PTTIEKQRALVEKTKDPVQQEAQAAILATMLYRKSKDAAPADKEQLLKDARQVLRNVAQSSGEKTDEITLRLLGTYELLIEQNAQSPDFTGAEKAWGQLVASAPKDKDALYNRAWWAYSLLKGGKNKEALDAVKDQALTDKQSELAYVTAWAKWRAADNAGAWQAIVTAAKGWGTNANKEIVDRDVLLFAGRAGGSLTDVMTTLTPIYGKTKDAQYELLAKLGLQSYQFAGRWKDGIAAIEKALETEGDKVPANDKPVLRYTQADYTVRLDDPATAAKLAKQALDALPACGTKCSDKDKENVVESVYVMGRLFHILYATAHDDRYYEPAHELYAAAVPLITMNDTVRTEAAKDQANLEGTFKVMKAGAGTHDAAAVGALLKRHNQEVQACYEQALSANPKLSGALSLTIEADQTGAIKGVSTDPKAGLQDMAMVAGCTAERAKKWTLPKRANGTGTPSTTRIKLGYALSAATPAPAAPKK
ncbi:MAG TPA: AgmX/PglI C-terminal domain-containing protein, partial [Kofleriaceae bacterium]|nr:AgmX/PglI C-terminal domain-containing protein [Kofleriaceae bacterium]